MIKPRCWIFSLLLLVSCGYSSDDFFLNENEKSFFDSFHAGDTIFYESATHDLDTILILGIDSSQKAERGWLMSKPASNRISVSFRNLPVNHSKMVIQDGSKFDTIYQELFAIGKLPQEKKVEFQFEFNSFFKNVQTLDSLYKGPTIINGKSFSNYYIIECENCNAESTDLNIDRLYWSQANGLVAYKNVKGDYWVKKSE